VAPETFKPFKPFKLFKPFNPHCGCLSPLSRLDGPGTLWQAVRG
jgi:hypothetical protein